MDVEQVYAHIAQQPYSALIGRILTISESDGSWEDDLIKVITDDAVFGVRFVFLAGLVNPVPGCITTVRNAVDTLGFEIVKTLALWIPLYTFDAVSPEETADQRIRLRDLWEHSLVCGLLAGRMVAEEDYSPVPMAFTAGLLHDVGRVLCYRMFKEEFDETLKLSVEQSIPLTQAERTIFGADHAEIGDFWAKRVGLPRLVTYAIRYHHTRLASLPGNTEALLKKTLAVIRIADYFGADSFGAEIGFEALETRNPLGDEWAVLTQRDKNCRRLVKQIQQEIAGIREMFGFDESTPDRSVRSLVGVGDRRRGRVIPFPNRGRAKDANLHETSKKLTILIVEDHGSLLEVLGLYFMRAGYHVRTASDGETALDILGREDVHLLVLDLKLPLLDGFGLLRRMQEKKMMYRPYIIVISAPSGDGDKTKVFELGADAYVPKPFHLSCLLDKIKTVEQQLAK
ncbi:MAG TPA: HDOD domain-containing protein [Verrucomicrobiae bacterium]|jgi:CheY-like chemotaxis protein|nr:HDOD domain-containing protein [Verrucomicrobiae bacterium]